VWQNEIKEKQIVELAKYKQISAKMAEETIILILLVVVMLVGSYLSGSIPLVMRLSEVRIYNYCKEIYDLLYM